MRITAPFPILICLVTVTTAWGNTAYFLKEGAVDAVKLLPEPPGETCPETRAELDCLLRLQETRTPAEIARAGMQAKSVVAGFQDLFGPWFNEDNLPQTMKLLRKVSREGKHCCDQAKQQLGRRRPQYLEPRIKPVFDGVTEACYPSGHAVEATVVAAVLAQLAPEYKRVVDERAQEIGWNRVVAGLHYPSDCTAGRVLGQAVSQALLADTGFKAELAKAKAEFDPLRKQHFRPGRVECR